MKTKNPKTGYGERDTEDLKFALMKKSLIVVSRGNGNGALGGEDGRIRSRLDEEGFYIRCWLPLEWLGVGTRLRYGAVPDQRND